MSLKDIRNQLNQASQAPFVRGTFLFSLGMATAITLLGNPQIFREEDSANWVSAFGSLAAAGVALLLGVASIRQIRKQEEERRHNACLVFYAPIHEGLAALEVIDDFRINIESDVNTAGHFKKKLEAIPAVISPENLQFIAHLPSEIARYVMLASQRLNTMKSKLAFVTNPADYSRSILDAELNLTKIYIPLGNMLQSQTFSKDETPWRQR